jgi:hypothetical protein
VLLLNGINYPVLYSFEEVIATSWGGFNYDTQSPSENGGNYAN